MDEAKALGQRLAEARRRAGMSQRDVQRATGHDQAVISRMEDGKRDVSALELARLAQLYGVSLDSLLGVSPVARRVGSEVGGVRSLDQDGYYGAAVQVG